MTDLNAQLNEAKETLPTTEAQLETTIDETNIGERDSGWTTVNLDTNGDGSIDETDIVQ